MKKHIKIDTIGNWDPTRTLLDKIKNVIKINILDKYGKIGIERLEKYTPKKTGLTSKSWYYTIEQDSTSGRYQLIFHNSNVQNYVNIALILQTGHATKNGGWVDGIDYIDPALQPIFEKLIMDIWSEVKYV